MSDVNPEQMGAVCFQFSNTEHRPSLLLCRFIASPLHVLVSCFGLLNEEQLLTTTAAVELDILEKPWISNVQSIEPFLNPTSAPREEDPTGLPSEEDPAGLPSEDDSTGLQLSSTKKGGGSDVILYY